MSEQSVYQRVSKQCFEMQGQLTPTDFVDKLETLLSSNKDEAANSAIADSLSFAYVRIGKIDEARSLLQRLISQHPEDEMNYSKLASHFFYFEAKAELALTQVEIAEVKSRASGRFRRMILGQKARIALMLERYDLVNYCLAEIPKVLSNAAVPDVGRERDFFDKANPKMIEQEIRKQYLTYLD